MNCRHCGIKISDNKYICDSDECKILEKERLRGYNEEREEYNKHRNRISKEFKNSVNYMKLNEQRKELDKLREEALILLEKHIPNYQEDIDFRNAWKNI